MRILKRLAIRLEDFARTRHLSRIKAFILQLLAVFNREALISANAQYLVSWHPVRRPLGAVHAAIGRAARCGNALSDSVDLERSILLKRHVSEGERGVLLVSFESELLKLARLKALPEFEDRYAIIFLPTWQPFYSEAIFRFAARAHRPYWIMPSASSDQQLCANLGPLCKPLPFQASSWVSERQYGDTAPSKTIDLLMLANFSRYKRHWRLFEAIKDMPDSVSIVLAGVPIGNRTIHSLRAEADAFGVSNRIIFRERPTDDEVASLLASAKVFCALSHKEGSYIAVAEALLAGTPVAIFDDAIVGSKEYICPETGWLLNPRQRLGPQLVTCLSRASTLHPREWAKRHIAAEVNFPRLNDLMRAYTSELGEDWSVDLAAFDCRHFEFAYSDPSAERDMSVEYQSVATQFGIRIARTPAGLPE
jgi:glycosyltransferase involved in cell wall biosynthesis